MDSLDYVLQLKARKNDHLAYQAAVEFGRAIDRLTTEGGALKRQDEVHMKTRRSLLLKIEAWKRMNKDTREHLRRVVDAYFDDSGAEPSISALGRAADEARGFLKLTRVDSPHQKVPASNKQERDDADS